MNVDEIREYCMSFPGAKEKLQWGDALCFKMKEKMFAVVGLDRLRFTFKCTPVTFAELIERENIRPAPYVGRYHWVMLERLDALAGNELRDLVRQSFEMVAGKAPKSKRSIPAKRKRASRRSGQESRPR